jgi:hypothetical protein
MLRAAPGAPGCDGLPPVHEQWTNVYIHATYGQKEKPCSTSYTPRKHRVSNFSLAAIQVLNVTPCSAGVKDADAAVILGGLSTKTVQRWRDGDYGRVSRDMADRMSNLLGIHKALRVVFSDPKRGYDWMNAENSAFADVSALDVLRRGGMEDLIRIRRYLDSVRGGW